jgi:hypothetical protein
MNKWVIVIVFAWFCPGFLTGQNIPWSQNEKGLYKEDLLRRSIERGVFDYIDIWKSPKIIRLLSGLYLHFDLSFAEYEELSEIEFSRRMIDYFDDYYDVFNKEYGGDFILIDSIIRNNSLGTKRIYEIEDLKGYWASEYENFPDLLITDSIIWIYSEEFENESITSIWNLKEDTLVLGSPLNNKLKEYKIFYFNGKSIILKPIGLGLSVYANAIKPNNNIELIGNWNYGLNIYIFEADGKFRLLNARSETIEFTGTWEVMNDILVLKDEFRYFEMKIVGQWNEEFIINTSNNGHNFERWKKIH